MPTDPSVYQYATTFGCLDDAAVGDGVACHSHVLREIARNSNRLAGKGGVLVNAVWRANTQNGDAETNGAFTGTVAPIGWRTLYPAPFICEHKPNLRTAEGRIRMSITNGLSLYAQICTNARPFDPGATPGRANVVELVGTGSMATYSFSGIPLSNSDPEIIQVYLQAEQSSTLMDGANGTNTGVVDGATPTMWFDADGNWVTANIPDDQYVVIFQDADSNDIYGPTPFMPNDAVGTVDQAFFQPDISYSLARLLTGANYRIYENAVFRCNAFVMYEEDLY